MDLRKYYMDNITEDDYYYRFYDIVRGVNETYNVFYGTQETCDYQFIVYDEEEAIEKFRYLCLPENEYHDQEKRCWFYVILFYFHKRGYYIEQFPKLIERPPMETYDFVNTEIRNRLITDGKDRNGTVPYVERRKLVGGFVFKKKDRYIELNEDIEAKFEEISTRGAKFQAMSTDEKLADIINLIENLLKKSGNYETLDYSSICYEYVSDEIIKKYKRKTQCFRHSSEQSLQERNSFTKEQKDFLIDFGLIIIKAIHALQK